MPHLYTILYTEFFPDHHVSPPSVYTLLYTQIYLIIMLYASASFAANVYPYGSSHKLIKHMSRKVCFFLYCGRTLQESYVLTLA
jgi:hypothetical protein